MIRRHLLERRGCGESLREVDLGPDVYFFCSTLGFSKGLYGGVDEGKSERRALRRDGEQSLVTVLELSPSSQFGGFSSFVLKIVETADFEGTNHLSVVVLLADYDKGELEVRQSTCLHHLEMSRIGDLACPNRYVDANSDSI
jgi:hypothetical protein